jgi:sialidase-1
MLFRLFLLFTVTIAAVFAGDDVAAALGGLRGRLIGSASETVAKNGEGSTILLKDGSLLHAFSRHMRPSGAGKQYPNPDLWPAVISGMVSRDSGKNWSEPAVVFRSTTGENAMQPSFARLANGEIGVSYSRIDSLSKATKVFRYSRDEGKTWSEEILISPTGSYWTSAHDRMTVITGGRLLLTLHHKVVVKPERILTKIGYSDDNGRTWKLAKQELMVEDVLPRYVQKEGNISRAGFWEASIAERADGSLFMIGRTYGGHLYGCESRDRGETWTQPQPTPLKSSPAPGKMVRIPGSNDLLVIWNGCCVTRDSSAVAGRITLMSAISTDGGATWKWPRVLEAITPQGSNRVEYPAVSIYDGVAYVTYRAQTGGGVNLRMQEYLAVLPIAWFYAERDQIQ